MTGSASDTAVFTAGTDGTLSIVTTDDAGTAANIQITADGTAELAGTTVTLDSSGGVTLDAGGGTITFADDGSSLGTITSAGYTGNVVGNVTGTADVATSITASANNTTNETVYLTFVDAATGTQGIETDTGLTYNPSTGLISTTALTATGAVSTGALTSTTITGSGDVAIDTDTLFVDVSENAVTVGTTVQVGDARLTVQGENAAGHDGVYSAQNGALGFCYVANNARNDTTLDGGVFKALRNGTAVGGLADTGVGGYFGTWSITDAAILTGETNVRLFADDTTGNIGIGTGTAAPSKKLTVDSGTDDAIVQFENEHAAFSVQASTDDEVRLYSWNDTSNGNAALAFYNYTGTSPSLYITADQNIGIGTETPGNQLEIAKSAGEAIMEISSWSTTDSDQPLIIFQKSASATIGTMAATADGEIHGSMHFHGVDSSSATSSSARIQVEQDGDAGGSHVPGRISFRTNGGSGVTEKMRINGDGNVGIGTEAPTGVLSVSANHLNAVGGLGTAANYAIVIECSSTDTQGNGIAFTNDDGAHVGAAIIHIDQGGNNLGDLAFYTKPTSGGTATERVRIDKLGNVAIGTAALATSATDGFLYIPSMAGAPSGTPTDHSNLSAIVHDTTNNKLYVYDHVDGAWQSASLT